MLMTIRQWIRRTFIIWLLAIHSCQAEVGPNDSLSALQAQMREYERIMQHYFRIDPTQIAQAFQLRARLYDQRATSIQKELNAEREHLDEQERKLDEVQKQIAALDARLRNRPAVNQPQAVATYNQTVKTRNDLVAQYNPQREALNAAIKQYNALVEKNKQQLDTEHKKLTGQQQKLEGLVDDYEEWINGKRGEAFWLDLNRTFARLITESQPGSANRTNSAYVAQMIRQIRQYRKELGTFAQTQAKSQSFGAIIVAAQVNGKEECHLVVDTGASLVTLTPEIAKATGLKDQIGGETNMKLAAGLETKGLRMVIPKMTVLGRFEKDVEGAIIPHSAVGIDGLLGRSFLFRYVVVFDGVHTPRLTPKPVKP